MSQMAGTQVLAAVPIPSPNDEQSVKPKTTCQECSQQVEQTGGWMATSGDFYCRDCWKVWRQVAEYRRQPADTENTSKAKGSPTVQLCKDFSAKRPRTCQCGNKDGPGCCCDVPSVPPASAQTGGATEEEQEEEEAINEELAQLAHIPYCDAHNHLDYCLLSEISMDYIMSLKKWICEWWAAGWCPYGSACAYAHGEEEQMKRPKLLDSHFLNFAKLHPLAPAPLKEDWQWKWSSSSTTYGPLRTHDKNRHHKDGGSSNYEIYSSHKNNYSNSGNSSSNSQNTSYYYDKQNDSRYNSYNSCSSYSSSSYISSSSSSISTTWSGGSPSQDSDTSSPISSGTSTPKAPKLQLLIHNCCEEETIDDAIFLADAGDRLYRGCVYVTFGCHPHNYMEYNNGFEQKLLQAVKKCGNKVVGWGECGLDYYKNSYALEKEPGTKQQMVRCFERQAQVAAELKLTFVVHTREAEEDTLRVLKQYLPREHRVHIHAFQNSLRFALEVLDYFPNSVIGISGVVTMPNVVETVVDLARNVPLDRMVLETDAPYLSPAPNNIPRIARAVAKLRGCTTEEVLIATNQACHRVYNIPM